MARPSTSCARRSASASRDVPGGVLEMEESIEDGLIREVLQETGLLVRPLEPDGRLQEHGPSHRRARLPLRGVQREAGLSDEAGEVRWLAPAKIVERMEEAYTARMLDALDDGRPRVRAHDGRALLRR